MTGETHSYDDPRGDSDVAWGVYESRCTVCGRPLAIVRKIDVPPAPDESLCTVCYSDRPFTLEWIGDDIPVIRFPVRIDA